MRSSKYNLSMRRAKRRNKNTKRRIGRKRGGNLKEITMHMLCWKSPKTVKNTLDSYKKGNLLSAVNTNIYFQERDDASNALAAEYGITSVMGTGENVGILRALIEMINATTTPYFMFAECDFELVETEQAVSDVLNDAMKLIREKSVSVVRLINRKKPGPVYSLNGKDSSTQFDKAFPYKLETLHVLDTPENMFPDAFTIVDGGGYNRKWYVCSFINNIWSNQIFLADMKFMKETILPLLEKSKNANKYNGAEKMLDAQCTATGALKDGLIAQGDGLFTHNRLNR
jgi:hypothetical protein